MLIGRRNAGKWMALQHMSTAQDTGRLHAFTVDVEDYHNVIARDWLAREGPPTSAVVGNTRRMLKMLSKAGALGTFFVLNEVAEQFPELIREIAAGGHELGVHGYYHRQLFKLSPESFRREVVEGRKRIEDVSGQRVRGHRAPAFSIVPETQWGLDVLSEAGFEYDSSIFPVRLRRYGWAGFPKDIHRVTLAGGRSMIEAPLSTVHALGRDWPVGGGGYLRHFPGVVTRLAMKRIGRSRPAILYTHPYEIEWPAGPLETAHLPPQDARRVKRFHWLQLRNRRTVEAKLRALLREFRFTTLGRIIDAELGGAEARRSA